MTNYAVVTANNGTTYPNTEAEYTRRFEFEDIESAIDEFATRCITFSRFEEYAKHAAEKELVEVFLIECGTPLDYTMVHKSFMLEK